MRRGIQILTSARIRGLQIEHKNKDGHTAKDLALQRDNIASEWHAAFSDLVASVDETIKATPLSSLEYTDRFSTAVSNLT